MRHFFQVIYTLWCAIVFVGIFLLLFPLYLLVIAIPKWHVHHFYLNRIWAGISLFLVGISAEISGRKQLDRRQQYVYCANHFSLLDILSFGFAPNSVVYLGKASLAKIPLFGFMFKSLHVTVDRGRITHSYKALLLALEKMGTDRSLVMFPEGGILSRDIPRMARFKDGAFRAAILKQIPLVPVTLPDNWIILPDRKWPLIKRKTMRMIFHEPIETRGLTLEDVPALKQRVFDQIDHHIAANNLLYDFR